MSLNSQANPEFSQKNPDTQEVLKYFDSIIENSESTLKDLRNVLLEIANNEDIKSLLLKNSIIMNIDDDEFTKSIIISDIRKNRLKRDFKMIHIKSKKTVGSYCIQET